MDGWLVGWLKHSAAKRSTYGEFTSKVCCLGLFLLVQISQILITEVTKLMRLSTITFKKEDEKNQISFFKVMKKLANMSNHPTEDRSASN